MIPSEYHDTPLICTIPLTYRLEWDFNGGIKSSAMSDILMKLLKSDIYFFLENIFRKNEVENNFEADEIETNNKFSVKFNTKFNFFS